mmetsp:Transcript_19100/g.40264  ORF Transcript_19100/g.40264 Transcript_19100/m.40264 type:complete len:353 (-) Transcript_19100:944-2002(-)
MVGTSPEAFGMSSESRGIKLAGGWLWSWTSAGVPSSLFWVPKMTPRATARPTASKQKTQPMIIHILDRFGLCFSSSLLLPAFIASTSLPTSLSRSVGCTAFTSTASSAALRPAISACVMPPVSTTPIATGTWSAPVAAPLAPFPTLEVCSVDAESSLLLAAMAAPAPTAPTAPAAPATFATSLKCWETAAWSFLEPAAAPAAGAAALRELGGAPPRAGGALRPTTAALCTAGAPPLDGGALLGGRDGDALFCGDALRARIAAIAPTPAPAAMDAFVGLMESCDSVFCGLPSYTCTSSPDITDGNVAMAAAAPAISSGSLESSLYISSFSRMAVSVSRSSDSRPSYSWMSSSM